MVDFSALQGLTIPEGVVTKIMLGDTVLWEVTDYLYDAVQDGSTLYILKAPATLNGNTLEVA